MKDADRHMRDILKRIQECGCVLMLDFDGVLSPIAHDPGTAHLSLRARHALTVCVKKMPVAIITGRSLADIKKRVAIKGVWYSGSHGLEWYVDGVEKRKRISKKITTDFAKARQVLLTHASTFPRVVMEDKHLCLAIGYRSLSTSESLRLRNTATELLQEHVRSRSIRLIDNLFTLEIIAAPEWTKGESAFSIFQKTRHGKSVPIYIGDSLTDEDAFRALRDGITIRVGKAPTSAAHYYFKTRRRVDVFLQALAKTL
jgi:trehalose-phosphatase